MNENGARVSSLESTVESTVSNDAVQARRRKKRKWDQPADVMFTAGIALPGVLPLGNAGFVGGTLSPAVSPIPGFSINPLVASGTTLPHLLHAPSVLPKLNQPKIQEELVIAREIVINDAESSVRYKLTKRQTQEEIQRCTSAVVITRGKYRPPNAPPDGEKPLYLHISAGAHLKETAERILAVDRAAAMVEEMLKPGLKTPSDTSNFLTAVSNGVKALSTTVYLGFEPDPSLNISARIRGPNDQYINHIMNETGATVALRGRGAEIFQSSFGEEVPQPLHLFLSSTNPKSLEDAKHLAENLLDTISVECGASRVSSCKSYSAVPPPQQLLSGVQGSGNEESVPSNSAAGLESPIVSIMPVGALASVTQPGATTIYPQGSVLHYGGLSNCVQPLPAPVSYPPPLLPRATSYSGYGDIYPQATPLQQVALALRQPHSPAITSSSVASTTSKSSVRSASKEKQPVQRRKFQELPVGSNEVPELSKQSVMSTDLGLRNISTMPPPRKLVQSQSNEMPPPPPKSISPPSSRTMPPPPLPPKFKSPNTAVKLHDKSNDPNKAKPNSVPDTLIKLMEYGDEDDDLEENNEESFTGNTTSVSNSKPFWAV